MHRLLILKGGGMGMKNKKKVKYKMDNALRKYCRNVFRIGFEYLDRSPDIYKHLHEPKGGKK